MTCFFARQKNMQNMQNHVKWFYVKPCRAKKTCARRQEKHVNIAQMADI